MLHIYTDGACSGNPGSGAWAWVMKFDGQYKGFYGCSQDTTNNQMEMKAVLEAMFFIDKHLITEQTVIFTDSKYVKDGLLSWIKNWKKNNWMNSARQPVKNKELWVKLDEIFNKHAHVTIEWVKGHSTNEGNNIADMIASCSILNPSHINCNCTKYLSERK